MKKSMMVFSKFFAPIILILMGGVAGIGIQQKVLNPKPVPIPACPDCYCPEQAAVSVQPFEVEKIKNLKAFTYSPAFTGQISVAGVDSVVIKRYINDAVMKAFKEHVTSVEPTTRKKRNERK